MTKDLASRNNSDLAQADPLANLPHELQEKVFVNGDLSKLSAQERNSYYCALCAAVGLSPLARPFQYIVLDKKLVLYPDKNFAEQARKAQRISVTSIERRTEDGIHFVTVKGSTPGGRKDEAMAAIALTKDEGEWIEKRDGSGSYFKKNGNVTPLNGTDKANAMMKCETKAKRRLTLSLTGLSFLDQGEQFDPEDVDIMDVDENGEIIGEDPDAHLVRRKGTGPLIVQHREEARSVIVDPPKCERCGELEPFCQCAPFAPNPEHRTPNTSSPSEAHGRRKFFAIARELGLAAHEGEAKRYYYALAEVVLGLGQYTLDTLRGITPEQWDRLAAWIDFVQTGAFKEPAVFNPLRALKTPTPESAAVTGLASHTAAEREAPNSHVGPPGSRAPLDEDPFQKLHNKLPGMEQSA